MMLTPASLLLAAIAIGAVGLTGSLVLMAHLRRERRVRQRLRGLLDTTRQPAAEPAGTLLVRAVATLGGAVARSGILSARTIGDLEQTLASSGLRGRNGIGLFIGTKLLLFTALPSVLFVLLPNAGFSIDTTRTAAMAAAVLGLLAPDFVVRRNRRGYLDRLDSGVADALDMMVICAQAGLGLETAMRRVAFEIRMARPEIADEMETTLKEMRIAVDSHRALTNLGVRTGLPSLKRVTATLAQTLQYGTPLTDALRVLSAEMRQEVLTKFEGKAARLPVMLTLPMILFIFPCLFIVIGGPAALNIIKAFSK
jgi:tight adherence protein C